MANLAPRGTIQRSFVNRDGKTAWLIHWPKGGGPSAVVSEQTFDTGQAVTLTATGALIPLRGR